MAFCKSFGILCGVRVLILWGERGSLNGQEQNCSYSEMALFWLGCTTYAKHRKS